MKGDFSRLTFDSTKHFSRVLMQQGRVTLDADHNEQAEIFLHALRALTRDLFGPFGGPAAESGFGLLLDPAGATSNLTLAISAGHYYVDGILCECDGCTYDTQPDSYTPPTGDSLTAWLKTPVAGKFFWLYLDVWERHISWVEDDSIREVALGGPDTCTRSKVVWQVKALELTSAPASCAAPLDGLVGLSAAWLAARLDPGAQLPDPCMLAPDAKYRGAENQLYRVEVHRGGVVSRALGGTIGQGPQPTFKWSRDNGSTVVPWLDTDGNDLVVTRVRDFEAGVWVEVSDDQNDLNGTPGQLLKLVKVEGDRLSIDPTTVPSGGLMARVDRWHPRVRRWDQTQNDATALDEGAVPIVEGSGSSGIGGIGSIVTWGITLEDGIQVRFTAGGQYRTGDYWLIPARVATGTIEWPTTINATTGLPEPTPLPPQGIEHHYAPLGIASFAVGGNEGLQITNCRSCFDQLPSAPCQANTLSPSSSFAGATMPAARSSSSLPADPKTPSDTRPARRPTAKTIRKR